MAASCAPMLSKMLYSRPGVLPIFFGNAPHPGLFQRCRCWRRPPRRFCWPWVAGEWGRLGFLSLDSWPVIVILFSNDVVQRDYKDDEGDGNREPPVVFAREVDTRAVDFNNGEGSIVDLDRRDGKVGKQK